VAAGRVGDEFYEWFRLIATDTDTIGNEIDWLPAVTNVRHGLNESCFCPRSCWVRSVAGRVPVGRRQPDGRVDIAERFVPRSPAPRSRCLTLLERRRPARSLSQW
jgi:hypothetical protein